MGSAMGGPSQFTPSTYGALGDGVKSTGPLDPTQMSREDWMNAQAKQEGWGVADANKMKHQGEWESANSESGKLLKKQQDLAKDFRSNIGSFEGNTYNSVQQQGMGDLNRNLGLIKSGNSSRGLLYGGVNQGMEGQARGSMANALANQRAGINSQAEQAANTLDQQAIQTGVGIQKQQQQIQNDIYARAMSDMNSENAMLGGLAQAAGTAAAIYFTGGAAAPALAGAGAAAGANVGGMR